MTSGTWHRLVHKIKIWMLLSVGKNLWRWFYSLISCSNFAVQVAKWMTFWHNECTDLCVWRRTLLS